jgi:aldose 1-epimerase
MSRQSQGQNILPGDRPAGWESAPEALIRLESPDGSAVALVCPTLGANVVTFAVKTPQGWREVLHQDGADALRERPSRFGLPMLFPFPGHMVGGQYTWRGTTYRVPMLNPSAPSFTHGFAHLRPWRVTEHSATSLTAVFDTRTDLLPEQRAGYPFDVTLTMTVSVESGVLSLTHVAENMGGEDAPVGIGLHPYFDPAGFGVPDRTSLAVNLPGRRRRLLTSGPPIPTGETEPANPSAPIQPVPLGQQMLVSRTDFDADRTTRIAAGDDRGSFLVDVEMAEGWEDVLLFAPADGPSISIEPHTCAPGASSLPEDGPDGQRSLAPGQRLRTRTTISTSHRIA